MIRLSFKIILDIQFLIQFIWLNMYFIVRRDGENIFHTRDTMMRFSKGVI